MSESVDIIDMILRERRSLETALAELLAKYQRSAGKSTELARMIRQLEDEIRHRRGKVHKTSR